MTIIGKPAGQEDGRLVSCQRTLFLQSEFRLLLQSKGGGFTAMPVGLGDPSLLHLLFFCFALIIFPELLYK